MTIVTGSLTGFGAHPRPVGFTSINLAFHASSTTENDANVVTPATVAAGDLIIFLQRSRISTGTAPTDVTPTGYTHIGTTIFEAGQSTRFSAKYKIAGVSDASATVTGMDENVDMKIILVFRGDSAITTATPAGYAGDMTNGDPAAQSITSGSAIKSCVVIGAFAEFQSVAITSESMSPTEDGSVDTTAGAGSESLFSKYKIYNASPANVTVDMNDEGAHNQVCGFYIECGA